MQLLQQALPQEEITKNQETVEISAAAITSNGNISHCKNDQNHQKNQTNGSVDNTPVANVNGTNNHHKHHNYKRNAEKENGYLHNNVENNHQDLPNNIVLTKPGSKANNLNFNNLQSVKNTNTTSYQQIQNGIGSSIKDLNVSSNNKCSPYKNNTYISSCKKEYEKEKIIKDYEDTNIVEPLNPKKKDKHKDSQQYHQQHQVQQATNNSQCEKAKVCEQCQKLEQEAKKLKSELQAMKNLEQETKQKFDSIKGNLNAKQKENEEAQKQ
jgi:hypothetical protein